MKVTFSFLAELQSLSIPGTYQEKITHLGSSLMNLTGLRSLDLSRNSLVSLEVSFLHVPESPVLPQKYHLIPTTVKGSSGDRGLLF